MSYYEYSIVYFDNCVVNSCTGRTVVESIENVRGMSKYPILYCFKIRVTGIDCYETIEFLKISLVKRQEEFPSRKQILIIIYDNPFIKEPVKLVQSATNFASFTRDLEGWCPRDEGIITNYQKEMKLNSTLPNIEGLSYYESTSKYIDNYIYCLALWFLDCFTALIHVSPKITVDDLTGLFDKIDQYWLSIRN